jgi:hypothetical protein
MAWSYGDMVLYRYGREGRTRFARIGRVIADDADGLALWIAPGSPQIESVLADGRGLREVPIADRVDLMDLAAAGAPPFDGRWTEYRPDPGWGPVSLPDDWDQPHRAAVP